MATLRRPVPVTETMPPKLATYDPKDWPAPRPGTPWHRVMTEEGFNPVTFIDQFRWLCWRRAQRDWEREHGQR
jgi:hypothetical protein